MRGKLSFESGAPFTRAFFEGHISNNIDAAARYETTSSCARRNKAMKSFVSHALSESSKCSVLYYLLTYGLIDPGDLPYVKGLLKFLQREWLELTRPDALFCGVCQKWKDWHSANWSFELLYQYNDILQIVKDELQQGQVDIEGYKVLLMCCPPNYGNVVVTCCPNLRRSQAPVNDRIRILSRLIPDEDAASSARTAATTSRAKRLRK